MTDAIDTATSHYFSEVGKHKLPTKKEEIELFTAYKKAQTREELGRSPEERQAGSRERARLGQNIACGYLRFVILQARRRTKDGQLLKDLISQGNVGLMIGVERFDLKHGVRFLTYAANWINVCMQEFLHKLGTVHIPNHTRKEMRRQKTQEDKLIAKGELRDYSAVDPNTTPLDSINVASDDDTELGAMNKECDLFLYMDQADLSRCERLVLVYSFGLRGTEFETDDLVQFLYELDGSLFSASQVDQTKIEAMGKMRALMANKGIATISDLL